MARKIAFLVLLSLTLFVVASAVPPPQSESPYEALRRQAESYYAEKSFARAHELYEQAAKLNLSADERSWVEFRLADTAWRNDSASPNDDPTVRVNAQTKLEAIIRETKNDRIRAEANESLGNYYLMHRAVANPHQALQHYTAALDYWAGSDDIEYARSRYLDIVWRMASGRYHHVVPISREILASTLTIAQTAEDRARVRYLLANVLLQTGQPADIERALDHLEVIIEEGKETEWYDDALITAAGLYQQGTNVVVNGQIERRADFARALELYRRILREFPRGGSRYTNQAERAIAQITEPSVSVNAPGTFLPDSEQEVILQWRNVKSVKLTLATTDLVTHVTRDRQRDWTSNLGTISVVRTWTFETNDRGDHVPGVERIRLTPKLPMGAYVITAEGGGKSSQNLVLVTDAHIVMHAAPRKLHVFVSDVLTGQPIANARVRSWHDTHRNNITLTREATTNASGIAEIAAPDEPTTVMLMTAAAGPRQAIHRPYSYGHGRHQSLHDAWKIYAFTDRPAYRPGETVQWKILARLRDQRGELTTPAGGRLHYQINSPRGEKVAEGEAKLNDFGAFWTELPLTSSMPLGVYAVVFTTLGENRQHVGYAQLFRLEEYKLPEFQVRVTTNDENGKPRLYRLGETIEATIEAEYYFGGPVANATVEAVIHQRPHVRYWYPWREYSWYFDPPQVYGGDVMRTETLRTDAAGRATVRIDTSVDGQEMVYTIEARVVDASRREVSGRGSVKVTRQRYSVLAHPEHHIYRPGDPVEIDFKAIDANDQPVQTTGTVKVVRREWREIPKPRFAGYREEEVMTTTVKTDANGEATFTFTPKRDGYYAIKWTSEDRDPDKPARVADLVTAETAVWVMDKSTIDTGYHTAGGVEIIVDKETLRVGQNAAVMIVTPASGRWVMLTTSGEDIFDTQVFRLDGTVKLLQIPIEKRHVPNFFVTASVVFDRMHSVDAERVVVPPVEHFLTVDVKSDREEYQPREEGTLTITTRDVDGRPVPAEVAVAVSDEAVTAIQSDLAADPRQFFFGETRPNVVHVSGGLNAQQYIRLVRGEDGKLIDDREEQQQTRRQRDGFDSMEETKALVGRAAAVEMAPPPAPVPPPPPTAPQTVTVTASAPMLKDMAANEAVTSVAEPMTVEVRTDFRSTAFWKPNVITDASGTATVKFNYPEALTTWRATARAASSGTQFGMGTTTARTKMPLIVRLQSPRFFVVGDRAVVSAVINNNTDGTLRVEPRLEVEGLKVAAQTTNAPVEVRANSDARVDWTVIAENPGTAKLRVTGRGGKYGDAMEKTFVVYEHGVDKLIARSGKLRGDEALVRLDLPRERRSTELVVQIAPSLAVTMLDALPYLVEYPYGCTEQTMSRFLPAAIVARTLAKMGVAPRTIDDKLGHKLDAVTRASMQRLYDMQHHDGGWGWWHDGESDAFMTAYVLWGFAVARDGGLDVDRARIDRAAQWLDGVLTEYERNWDRQAWLLHALSAWRATPSANARKAYDNVWTNRERLSAYSRALLALTAHRYKDTERTAVLVRNLENGAKIDRAPDQSVIIKGTTTTAETMATAHWGASGFWWNWYESPVETTAFVLQALVNIDPKHKLVEPAMNWLVKNRRGAQWSNTRDTAIAVLSLNDYLVATGETIGNVSYELSVNGRVIATKSLTAADAIAAPSRFTIDPSIVRDTQQEIRIRRTGGRADAALYFSAEARFVSLEEPVKAAGNELFVKREYFRLKPRPTLLKGVLYDRVPLLDGESINSGDRVEVLATIETKNNYEYLLFEDLKPAGFEAVELQSGTNLYATKRGSGATQWVYQELRDRKVAMFIDHLSQGVWEVRYTLRAETPGSFHALPLLGQAMYVPDIRANSDEVRVEVKEAANPAPVSP